MILRKVANAIIVGEDQLLLLVPNNSCFGGHSHHPSNFFENFSSRSLSLIIRSIPYSIISPRSSVLLEHVWKVVATTALYPLDMTIIQIPLWQVQGLEYLGDGRNVHVMS